MDAGHIIALGIGAALVASGAYFARNRRKPCGLGTGLDDYLPREAQIGGTLISRAGGGKSSATDAQTINRTHGAMVNSK